MKSNRSALHLLAHKIGLPDLVLNAESICELVVGDGLEVFFEGDPDQHELHLNGVVGHLVFADESLLRTLLAANFNGQATGGAALALHPVHPSELLLTQQLDTTALTGEQMKDTLTRFVEYLTFWQSHLPRLQESGETQPVPQRDAPVDQWLRV